MSYGQMNTFIDLIEERTVRTARVSLKRITSSRPCAYRGSARQRTLGDRAQFSEATDLFRFRVIHKHNGHHRYGRGERKRTL